MTGDGCVRSIPAGHGKARTAAGVVPLGTACPLGNEPAEGKPPRMPDSFKTEVDKDGWRH